MFILDLILALRSGLQILHFSLFLQLFFYLKIMMAPTEFHINHSGYPDNLKKG